MSIQVACPVCALPTPKGPEKWVGCECGHCYTRKYVSKEDFDLNCQQVNPVEPQQDPNKLQWEAFELERTLWSYSVDLLQFYSGNSFTLNKPPSLLDIGAGGGIMLHLAAELGWKATGVEPRVSPKTVLSQTFPMYSYLEDVPVSESFDFIVMCDVIEHVPNIHDFLNRTSSLAKAETVLLLSTPNRDTHLAHLWGPMDPYWKEEEHCHYFDFKTIQWLLSQTGWHIKHYSPRGRYRNTMTVVAQRRQ